MMERKQRKNRKNRYLQKKYAVSIFCMALSCALTGCGKNTKQESSKEENTLVVFNYGDYIEQDTLDLFEKETGIKVKYEEYVTPEDMYTKYQSGAIDYDLICTSDYMVEKMIQEGEVQKIDTSDMKYLSNIDQKYWDFCQTFDRENVYAIPYFWGTVGILYNKSIVNEEVDSWSVLWKEKYKNQIIMENSMRDAFLVPLKWKGNSLNTTKKEELLEAQNLLKRQKPIVEAYLVDESRDAMIAGDAAMAVIYSGDATMAMESNEDLAYCVPKEGSNIWFDCWMIPKSAAHKAQAEKFMDFMNREDVAGMNFDYVYYGTPNKKVYESLDEETKEEATIFPEEEVLNKCEVYQYLGSEMDTYYNQLWKELKSY